MQRDQRAKVRVMIGSGLAGHAVRHLVGQVIGGGWVQMGQHIHQLSETAEMSVSALSIANDATTAYRDIGGMVSCVIRLPRVLCRLVDSAASKITSR